MPDGGIRKTVRRPIGALILTAAVAAGSLGLTACGSSKKAPNPASVSNSGSSATTVPASPSTTAAPSGGGVSY